MTQTKSKRKIEKQETTELKVGDKLYSPRSKGPITVVDIGQKYVIVLSDHAEKNKQPLSVAAIQKVQQYDRV